MTPALARPGLSALRLAGVVIVILSCSLLWQSRANRSLRRDLAQLEEKLEAKYFRQCVDTHKESFGRSLFSGTSTGYYISFETKMATSLTDAFGESGAELACAVSVSRGYPPIASRCFKTTEEFLTQVFAGQP